MRPNAAFWPAQCAEGDLITRGNATQARVRSDVEYVIAVTKVSMGLVVRTVGLARATAMVALANFACDMRCLVWRGRRAAPS